MLAASPRSAPTSVLPSSAPWLAVCGAREAVACDTAAFGVVERTGVERTPS